MCVLIVVLVCLFFFFFQAEDGIRDGHVTGVQTCALPISVGTRSVSVISSTAAATSGAFFAGRWANKGCGREVAARCEDEEVSRGTTPPTYGAGCPAGVAIGAD